MQYSDINYHKYILLQIGTYYELLKIWGRYIFIFSVQLGSRSESHELRRCVISCVYASNACTSVKLETCLSIYLVSYKILLANKLLNILKDLEIKLSKNMAQKVEGLGLGQIKSCGNFYANCNILSTHLNRKQK